jgi:uncharacterized DUF497 family protein
VFLRFDWDEKKSRSNMRKHGVDFATAALVFDDPHCQVAQDREVDGEARWQAIGWVEGLFVLMVAHTVHDDDDEEVVRIISAREVTAHERRGYESGES